MLEPVGRLSEEGRRVRPFVVTIMFTGPTPIGCFLLHILQCYQTIHEFVLSTRQNALCIHNFILNLGFMTSEPHFLESVRDCINRLVQIREPFVG